MKNVKQFLSSIISVIRNQSRNIMQASMEIPTLKPGVLRKAIPATDNIHSKKF